jgi:hypothetical protein
MKCYKCKHPDWCHFTTGCAFTYQAIIERLPYVIIGLEKHPGYSIHTETIGQCGCKLRHEVL